MIAENMDHSLLIAQLQECADTVGGLAADLMREAAYRLDIANRHLDAVAVEVEAKCRSINWNVMQLQRALHGGIRIEGK